MLDVEHTINEYQNATPFELFNILDVGLFCWKKPFSLEGKKSKLFTQFKLC